MNCWVEIAYQCSSIVLLEFFLSSNAINKDKNIYQNPRFRYSLTQLHPANRFLRANVKHFYARKVLDEKLRILCVSSYRYWTYTMSGTPPLYINTVERTGPVKSEPLTNLKQKPKRWIFFDARLKPYPLKSLKTFDSKWKITGFVMGSYWIFATGGTETISVI